MAERIGVSLAAVGICIALWALSRLFARKRAENNYARCAADMHSAVKRRFSILDVQDPVMTYTIADKTYMTRMHTADAGTVHQTGGRYIVLYDPKKPENAVFEVDIPNARCTRVLFILGGTLIAAGLVCGFLAS